MTKVITIFLLFLTFSFVSSSHASEDKGIFEILGETYIDNITNLPYSSGNPEKNIQSSGHIRGWIDIVGFDKMSKDNNIYYVPGNPTNYAIIQYDAWGVGSACGYEITKNIQKYISGDNAVAVLSVKLIWYTIQCGKNSCSCVAHTDYASFNDTEKSPKIIEPLTDPKINIIQYNNTLYENIGIQIIPKDVENLSRFDITYNNSSLTRTFKTGYVEKTEKGIFFANLTKMPIWETSGKDIGRIENTIFINGNLSKINASNIKISTSNLYETKYHTNFTISREEFRPEKETIENPLLISFWSIIIVIFGGAYIAITKMRII